jgi:hypothetical protein
VIAVGVLLVGNPLNRPVGSAGPGHTPNASPAAAPTPSPSPSPTASPNVTCSSEKITPTHTPPTGFIDAMRTGTHAGYDRVTIELKNGLPTSIELRPQTSATFTLSPSNQPVTLAGTDGMLVILKGADMHTAYKGGRDIKTNYPGIVEVRVLEDFEGQVSLGLGLKVNPCPAPLVLSSAILVNPYRVVIDIPTS